MNPPENPAGEFRPEKDLSESRRTTLIASIEVTPAAVRCALTDLTEAHLNVRYRNWTIRQIVHHLADSHVNSYIRFKWALTEDQPTIKTYNEDRWSVLADARTGDVGPPLALLDAIHARWIQLMRTMTTNDFARTFLHPQSGQIVNLDEALNYYAWHGIHHLAQIDWLRQKHGW